MTAMDPTALVVPEQRSDGESAAPGSGTSEPLSWSVLTWVLEHGGVATAYQPIIDVKRERIVGWEALVRAQHPEIGARIKAASLGTATIIGDQDGELAIV